MGFHRRMRVLGFLAIATVASERGMVLKCRELLESMNRKGCGDYRGSAEEVEEVLKTKPQRRHIKRDNMIPN